MSGSVSRRPRLRMLANGTPVAGIERAEVNSNGYLQCDRFHTQVALGADSATGPAWWSAQTDIRVDIQAGLLPDGAPEGSAPWQSLLIGTVDHLHMDIVRGVVSLEGRDLASLLIDAKTQETFANQTASQVAVVLAQRHGLTPVVTATSAIVGQYYQLEHDKLTLNNFHHQTTEWDLLTYLAGLEGFDVFVQGTELHFQPAAGPDAHPFPVLYQPGPPPVMNVTSLDMERSLTLAKDIQVTVKSWNSRHQAAYTRVVKGAAKGGNVQNYVFVKPNLTPDEALKFAQAKLAELTRHERVIQFEVPGELSLTPRSIVALSGTGTDFDQPYYVAELEREISFEGGFRQRVRAKNSSPRTQTTVL